MLFIKQEGITVNQTWGESLGEQDDVVNTASVPSDYNSDLDTTECVDNSKNDDLIHTVGLKLKNNQ